MGFLKETFTKNILVARYFEEAGVKENVVLSYSQNPENSKSTEGEHIENLERRKHGNQWNFTLKGSKQKCF